MEKYISATQNRPQGDRIIDADTHLINIADFKSQVKNESTWLRNDRNAVTLFKSEHVAVILMTLHSNAKIKSQISEGIMSLQLLDGKILFETEQTSLNVQKEQIVMLHKAIMYSIDVKQEATILLTIVTL